MIVLRHGEAMPDEVATVATIGSFDGVHLGHRHLIADVLTRATERRLAPAVITFDTAPRQVLHPDSTPQPLCTTDEKLALLDEAGIAYCGLLHFDRQLAALSASDFMDQVLHQRYHVRQLVIGYDNRFGHDRSEGFADYVAYGRQMGIEVVQSTPYEYQGVRVSSSLIRQLIAQGDVATASRYLGRPYSLGGMVVAGYQEGRRMGYPTANMGLAGVEKMLPAHGAYATQVRIDCADKLLPAMTNVGQRPTFGRADTTIETHILDFGGDIYGHHIDIYFYHRLRGERRFGSETELMAQLRKDEQRVRQLLTRDI